MLCLEVTVNGQAYCVAGQHDRIRARRRVA
jgi:hypothetical protein